MRNFTLLSFAFLCLLHLNTLNAQSAKKYEKAGKEFFENNNFADASTQFSKALELAPEDADLYMMRGQAYNKLKKYAEALEDFKRCLTFDPKNDEVFYHIGFSNYYLGSYNEALKYMALAYEADRKNANIFIIKANAYSKMGMFNEALAASDTVIQMEAESAELYYQRAVLYDSLMNKNNAKASYNKAISINANHIPSRLNLAEMLLVQGKTSDAMTHAMHVLNIDKKNIDAYLIKSRIHVSDLDYPDAINDVSKTILISDDNAELYIIRGTYYQEFNQHANAITDFTKAISMDDKNPEAYIKRAKSYEEILKYEEAAADYVTITSLSEYDMRAKMLLDKANERIYEINREQDNPQVVLDNPVPKTTNLEIAGDAQKIVISGKIKEKSAIENFTINGEEVHYEGEPGLYEFIATVDVSLTNTVTIITTDIYKNQQALTYDLKRMETNAPLVSMFAPYASDNNEIYLESNDPIVFFQGRLSDESEIKSVFIEGVTASYKVDELNPAFTATVNVANKNSITVEAEDVYGNKQVVEYTLNREGANLSEQNPMGKTWVVFIENSNYETFASLQGPEKDITLMQKALVDYQIHNIIQKKDLSKKEMEKFFSIELRDMVRSNQVKSLLVWYAGHGKFINNVGYWIPVDASRDDEFTYFNINSLKAGMQGYTDVLVHTLVITDACESGPSFYMAMRNDREEPSCGDWKATQFKSSQVFSSAGYELAVDDSQFTRTFANALLNNPDDCIPIESIVQKVSVAVKNNNQQSPIFGKIKGMQDENGTFFFITKPAE